MDITTFLESCRLDPDGFVSAATPDAWRLGGVVFAQGDKGIAAIQKAPRNGYAFSDFWALPGGMIRVGAGAGEAFSAAFAQQAVSARAGVEAGLPVQPLEPVPAMGPMVTSYLARGATRFTLVVAFRGREIISAPLCPGDPSIRSAAWLATEDIDLSRFAPANRLILAHLLWACYSEHRRSAARSSIDHALELCSGWAREVGITPPPAPWASEAQRHDWVLGWPAKS